MNLSGNKSRLVSATQELMLRWQETRNCWRDDKSREFDEHYMQDLRAQVDKAVTLIEKLDEVLKKVQSDCE